MSRKDGVGNTVDILNDPWLPDHPYVQTSNEALRGHIITSLMSPDGNQWDVDLYLSLLHIIMRRTSRCVFSLKIY